MHSAHKLGCSRAREHGFTWDGGPAKKVMPIRFRNIFRLGSGFLLGILTTLVLSLRQPQNEQRSVQASPKESAGLQTTHAPSRKQPRSQATETPQDPANGVLDYERLRSRALAFPLSEAKLSLIRDTFDEKRGGTQRHEASDILAPRGTPVLAVDDGTIRKLFLSDRGGMTIYQFDDDEVFCYYYAHLDRYIEGLREGLSVKRGQCIGYVGTSGNAAPDTPHLHFAIFKLGPEKRWWEGRPMNPYAVLIEAARRVAPQVHQN